MKFCTFPARVNFNFKSSIRGDTTRQWIIEIWWAHINILIGSTGMAVDGGDDHLIVSLCGNQNMRNRRLRIINGKRMMDIRKNWLIDGFMVHGQSIGLFHWAALYELWITLNFISRQAVLILISSHITCRFVDRIKRESFPGSMKTKTHSLHSDSPSHTLTLPFCLIKARALWSPSCDLTLLSLSCCLVVLD